MNDIFEVTIGIPVFQSISYIMDTMTSALNQTFCNIEYLIVDDCGKDGTIDLIKDLQNKHSRGENIRILKNDSNRGVGHDRGHHHRHHRHHRPDAPERRRVSQSPVSRWRWWLRSQSQRGACQVCCSGLCHHSRTRVCGRGAGGHG